MNLKFVRKFTEAGSAVSFIFEPESLLTWQAGQYLSLTLPGLPPAENERMFTISAAPYEKHIQITTRVTPSLFKQALNSLDTGAVVEADQFGGDFIWTKSDAPRIFIAGGIGITPFHSILKQRHHENAPLALTLLYGSRDEDIVFKAELDKLNELHPEFGMHYVVGERLDASRVEMLAPHVRESLIYISGPEPMVDAMENQLKEFGVHKSQLKQDWFPGYDQHNY